MAKLRTNLQQFILTKRFTWKMLEDRRKQGAVYVEQKFVKLKLWKNFNHLNAFFKSKFHRENRNKFWESSKENMSRNQNGIPLIIYPRIPTTEPVARTCPHCLQEIITNPRKKTGRYQQCLSFILCCLILPFCCFWIPLTKDEMNASTIQTRSEWYRLSLGSIITLTFSVLCNLDLLPADQLSVSLRKKFIPP